MKANVIKKLKRTKVSGQNSKYIISQKIINALDDHTDSETLIDVIFYTYNNKLPNAKEIIEKVEKSLLENQIADAKLEVHDGYLCLNEVIYDKLNKKEAETFNEIITHLKNQSK